MIRSVHPQDIAVWLIKKNMIQPPKNTEGKTTKRERFPSPEQLRSEYIKQLGRIYLNPKLIKLKLFSPIIKSSCFPIYRTTMERLIGYSIFVKTKGNLFDKII